MKKVLFILSTIIYVTSVYAQNSNNANDVPGAGGSAGKAGWWFGYDGKKGEDGSINYNSNNDKIKEEHSRVKREIGKDAGWTGNCGDGTHGDPGGKGGDGGMFGGDGGKGGDINIFFKNCFYYLSLLQ